MSRIPISSLVFAAALVPCLTSGAAPQVAALRGDPEAATRAQGEGAGESQSPLERIKNRARATVEEVSPLRRADGSIILPGEIPVAAGVEARAIWKGLVDSLQQVRPLQSFRLEFYLRQEDPDPAGHRKNDLDLAFSYLAPRYVRAQLESGRTHLRGPAGDFLIDKAEVRELFGRGATEDLEQLDQMGAIASNFVALCQPVATLRLVELELSAKPPAELHPSLLAEAQKLTWLDLTSPDFYLDLAALHESAGAGPLFRAQLGLDPKSHAVRIAVIHERRGAACVQPSAMCVRMTEHLLRDGLQVPHLVEVFAIDPATSPARFYGKSSSKLWLDRTRGSLRTRLTPEDFLPPR